jgi:hypothetical protein
VRGDRGVRLALLPHGYHERGADWCVPGATAVQGVAYLKNVAASRE